MTRFRRSSSVILPVVLLLALSGCAVASNAATSTASPSPSATPSVETPTVVERPAVAFDGDCAAVFGDAGAATFTAGATSLPIVADELIGVARTIEVLGGFRCSGGDAIAGDALSMTVVPTAALDGRAPAQATTCSESDSGAGPQRECWATVETGGYSMSAWAIAAPASSFDPEAVVAEASSRLAAAADGSAPVVVALPDGSWAPRTECAPIAAAAATVLGDGVTGAYDRTTAGGPGMDVGFAADDAVGWGRCVLSPGAGDPARDIAVTFLPGAGWALEELLSSGAATSTEVDGAVLAAAVTGDAGDMFGDGIAATDGVNLMFVTTQYADAEPPTEALAAAILAAS
ncbi:hypothetical protein [Agromyces sp. NPDC058104]|uniref:hypothetical protein n=1 Tax=Agromyces sp. NPDC058104 TaxID=3346342 RepID=UPI0036DC6988